ncbi:hypothetical protein LC085_17125 [Bacillus tianshenii]|uniref:hypothetical protein n=1 Tax=Sutcliffiella tianshenii TaxID=1463404 RepID=UPI001CD70899|nr:hypothetical protein [Bacillus tianshenii]MCA1321631.1 hypothetical protein [Bacillus tianshenii]
MNKLTKGMIFALIFTIIFTLLPHNPFSQVAEANTLELDHPYYVIGAALYEDTAFLLGTELEDGGAEDMLKFVARKGDQTTTLISEEEMEISSPYIRFDGTDKLVLEGFSWTYREDVMYIIDKATLEVEKKTESEFYSVFFQALEDHGYTVDEFSYYHPRYGNDGPEWLIFEKYNYQNEDGKYIYPPTVMVHKSGKVITEQFEYGTPSIGGNINGEIFYQDFDRNIYLRINPDGTKTEFLLPEELADRYVNLQDKQYRIYIDAPDSSFDVYQLKTDGSAATYITNINNVGWYMYENRSGDIWYTKPSEDYYYSTFGYLDENLKPNDVFSYPHQEFLDMSAHGNHFIVYTHTGYSVLTKQDAAIAPEGWVQVNDKW